MKHDLQIKKYLNIKGQVESRQYQKQVCTGNGVHKKPQEKDRHTNNNFMNFLC